MNLANFFNQGNYNLGTMYGTKFNGSMPSAPQTPVNAPQYSTAGLGDYFNRNAAGAQAMDPMLRMALRANGQGTLTRGVGAFLGGAYDRNTMGGDPLRQLAQQTGAVDHTQYTNTDNSYWNRMGVYDSTKGINQLENDLNTKLGNYYGVSGLSQGWNPSRAGATGANQTLYQDTGTGNLTPLATRAYNAPQRSGFWGADGLGEGLRIAASFALPAFGGAAGILGQGAAGTLSAGSGLGVTSGLTSAIGTGATNALVNAGSNYLLNGGKGGLTGLGMGLLGQVGSAAGNSLFGQSGGLGDMFRSAGDIGGRYNSIQGMSNIMNNTGMGNSPLGALSGLFGGLGQNGFSAGTAANLAGQLGGRYLGNRINPQLGGLGGQAGGYLANLFRR